MHQFNNVKTVSTLLNPTLMQIANVIIYSKERVKDIMASYKQLTYEEKQKY